jgi:hypothetical protein
MRARTLTLFAYAVFTAGCATGSMSGPPPSASEAGPQEEKTLMVPPGYGTLLQDQISLRLQSGDLLIKVTPLDEAIVRLTAPDTYERLKGLADVHGPRASNTMGSSETSLFLVSLFSYQPDITYEPEDLNLINRGLRMRPLGIAAITPSWGTQRLGQQETRMAVYAFDGGMEWETDLVAEYQQLRNETWRDQIVPLLQAERTKVRARSGG